MNQVKNWTILCIVILLSLPSYSQNDDLINTHLFMPSYSFEIPLGKLSERFGGNSTLGMAYKFKYGQNWVIGGDVNFMFSGNVKEEGMYDAITTTSGLFIDVNGLVNEFSLSERGVHGSLSIGKIVWSPDNSANSGLLIGGGIGYLQHKISINLSGDDFPQINEDLRKGYDRFTSGVTLNQSIGYLYLKPEKFINFYIGLEVLEGITKLRRPWVLDLNTADKSTRFDMLIGLKTAWIIPVFKGRVNDEDEFFYD
ncbi:MAG: hypothetical protein HKN92_00890 [Chitinophagales bacterium]|nr:hypothetical protein [Chitinophagales bacterium]